MKKAAWDFHGRAVRVGDDGAAGSNHDAIVGIEFGSAVEAMGTAPELPILFPGIMVAHDNRVLHDQRPELIPASGGAIAAAVMARRLRADLEHLAARALVPDPVAAVRCIAEPHRVMLDGQFFDGRNHIVQCRPISVPTSTSTIAVVLVQVMCPFSTWGSCVTGRDDRCPRNAQAL